MDFLWLKDAKLKQEEQQTFVEGECIMCVLDLAGREPILSYFLTLLLQTRR